MKDKLYDYVFWNNTYEEVWYAIPRESYALFFSGKHDLLDIDGVEKSKSIEDLIKKI
jgi:hypothetical protein